MKHIFHILTIVFIFNELGWLSNPVKRMESSKLFKRLSKEMKGKGYSEWTQEYKDMLYPKVLVAFAFLTWMVGGLLSFNWLLFLVFFIMQIIIITPLTKLFKFSKTYVVLHWFNALVGLCVGLFVLINSYHLKIDLLEFVMQYF